MGDRTPFQCAMIYNDQKDFDWFHPWLSQYGRTKRRTVGNRQQRFLSSANAITARPNSADKPPRGVCLLLACSIPLQEPRQSLGFVSAVLPFEICIPLLALECSRCSEVYQEGLLVFVIGLFLGFRAY